jgi:hypothetical protein
MAKDNVTVLLDASNADNNLIKRDKLLDDAILHANVYDFKPCYDDSTIETPADDMVSVNLVKTKIDLILYCCSTVSEYRALLESLKHDLDEFIK